MSPEPTHEQRQLLSRIVNENQRRALERAIARGDRIPEYAWHPVPVLPPEAEELIRRKASELLDRALARGRDPFRELEAATPYLEPVDYGFRPETYWPDDEESRRLLAIKGTARRRAAAEAIDREGKLPDDVLFADPIEPALREGIGGIQPSMMGGEFLPDLAEREVEIARIEMASVTGDVISVRARRTRTRIAYRAVDEYGGSFSTSPKASKRPLDLGRLLTLIDSLGSDEDERYEGRFVDGLREGALVPGDRQQDEDLQEAAEFVDVRSHFYPQLEVHYRGTAKTWLEERRLIVAESISRERRA